MRRIIHCCNCENATKRNLFSETDHGLFETCVYRASGRGEPSEAFASSWYTKGEKYKFIIREWRFSTRNGTDPMCCKAETVYPTCMPKAVRGEISAIVVIIDSLRSLPFDSCFRLSVRRAMMHREYQLVSLCL